MQLHPFFQSEPSRWRFGSSADGLQWCTCNGYALDDSMRDDGRSAFRGKNATGRRTALANFLVRVKAGLIRPGSALILESLDRLSRQKIKESIDLARGILEQGVDIVTLVPEVRFSKSSLDDPMAWMQLVLLFNRAHEESKIKSERLKDRWSERRKVMTEKKLPVTRRLPFWITLADGGFVVNEKVAIVRRVYDLATKSKGIVAITRELNRDGVKVLRAVVIDRHLIRNLLHNRQVLGEQICRTYNGIGDRPIIGESIIGYFSAVISEKLFHRVQAAIATAMLGARVLSFGACAQNPHSAKRVGGDVRRRQADFETPKE